MNIRLLRKVQKAIKAHPDQFQMRTWYSQFLDIDGGPFVSAGGCGTAACIGGWAIHLHWRKLEVEKTYQAAKGKPETIYEIAKWILRLSRTQADKLFDGHMWPDDYQGDYEDSKTPEEQAAVAIRRIDHFIKTKGEE